MQDEDSDDSEADVGAVVMNSADREAFLNRSHSAEESKPFCLLSTQDHVCLVLCLSSSRSEEEGLVKHECFFSRQGYLPIFFFENENVRDSLLWLESHSHVGAAPDDLAELDDDVVMSYSGTSSLSFSSTHSFQMMSCS